MKKNAFKAYETHKNSKIHTTETPSDIHCSDGDYIGYWLRYLARTPLNHRTGINYLGRAGGRAIRPSSNVKWCG